MGVNRIEEREREREYGWEEKGENGIFKCLKF